MVGIARKTFNILSPVTTEDEVGGIVTSWEEAFSVTGHIDLITGSDLPTGGGDNAFVENSTHIAIITPLPEDTITDAMRLQEGDSFGEDENKRVYEITYVDNPVGAGHHLELYLRFVREESELGEV
jgi:head-tail adaptor